MKNANQMLAVKCKDCNKVQAVSIVEGGTSSGLRKSLNFLASSEKRNKTDAVFMDPKSSMLKPQNWCKCGEKKTSFLDSAKKGTLARTIVEYAEAKSHLDMMNEHGVGKDVTNAEKTFALATAEMEKALVKNDRLIKRLKDAAKAPEAKEDDDNISLPEVKDELDKALNSEWTDSIDIVEAKVSGLSWTCKVWTKGEVKGKKSALVTVGGKIGNENYRFKLTICSGSYLKALYDTGITATEIREAIQEAYQSALVNQAAKNG